MSRLAERVAGGGYETGGRFRVGEVGADMLSEPASRAQVVDQLVHATLVLAVRLLGIGWRPRVHK